MSNREKLQQMMTDIFLLGPTEFRFDLRREEIETWDSLGVVSLAVGVEQTFGHHFTPDEASGVRSVEDIMQILSAKGIDFGN